QGRPDELIEKLKSEMIEAAKNQKFEKAAGIRDKLQNLEELFEKQRISDPSRIDTDVFHYITDEKKIYSNLFQIREGKITGQENFIFDGNEIGENLTPNEIIEAFLRDYYEKATSIPKEILIPDKVENKEMFEEWLSSKKNGATKGDKKVKIIFPVAGEKNHLLELSLKNAASFAHQQKARWMKENENDKESLEGLAKVLNLKKLPKRMECYDISHIGGTSTVASMVVFTNGIANNAEYRRFKLQTIPEGKPDDYASMEEVLTRRLKYIKGSIYPCKTPNKKMLREIEKTIQEQKGAIDEIENIQEEKSKILCMMDEETMIGFARITENAEIRSLWIHKKYRGQKLGYDLIYKLIEKMKDKVPGGGKKCYVYVLPNLKEYYENFGFQEVKNIPENFKERIEKADAKNKDRGILLIVETGKLLAQHKKFAVRPDVIILDGGKGQLSIGVKVLKKLKLEIPICSLAKREEEIFTPEKKTPILLTKDSKTLHLFQRIRDEAHRFAITYSGKSHNKSLIISALDEISGIGELSKQKLLNAFGSVENIKMAPLDQLARVIGKKTAIQLKQELQKMTDSDNKK
ncbi:MAG: GNAT family N-acetyltransferase, partial [Patescibacteria group bacterium]